jgi:hypothetical protein
VLLLTQVHTAQAQTDPYSGGTVTPGTPCLTSTHVTVNPSANVQLGAVVTVTTTGATPGNPVFVFMDNVLTSQGSADPTGTFVTSVTSPSTPGQAFIVCASAPPCAMACADPVLTVGTKVLASGETNGSGNGSGSAANRSFARTGDDPSVSGTTDDRGFARTGIDLLPWLLAALLCIAVGRQLVKASRRKRETSAQRVKTPRVRRQDTSEEVEREDILVP